MMPQRSQPLQFRRKLPLLLFTAGFLVLFLLFNLKRPDLNMKSPSGTDTSSTWNMPSIELPDSQPKTVRGAMIRLREWLLMGAVQIDV